MSRKAHVLVLLTGAMLAFLSLCGPVDAAAYWGNGNVIRRINLDGTYRLDEFIRYSAPPQIGPCGIAVDGSHIYWGDSQGLIGRANLDGSEPNFAFISGVTEPCGLAVDGSHIYWANRAGSTIGRARLDGSDVDQDFITIPIDKESPYGAAMPCGLAVDGSHIFWANFQEGLIGRASLNGEVVTPNFIEGLESPCGVAVNGTNLFWGSYSSTIGRADLDGSDLDDQFITGLDDPCGVAIDGSHIYWSEQGSAHRSIGRASLDGGAVDRNFVSEIQSSCGIAVDSLAFTPPPPPVPQAGTCELGAVKRNRAKGSAIVAVNAPAHGSIQVLTKGLRWRALSDEAPWYATDTSTWLSWIKVWPGSKGGPAKGIQRRLRRRGHATLDLRVKCEGRVLLPAEASRKMTLSRRLTSRSDAGAGQR